MESQTDGLLIQRALRQLTPDVFHHPVWIRFAGSPLAQSTIHIPSLVSAVNQMQALGDVPGACSLLFLCAALQAGQGDYPAAQQNMQHALKLAKRHALPQVTIWVYWSAAAICAQMGSYSRCIEWLARLQHELHARDEWVLANLIELICQVLADCAARRIHLGQYASTPGVGHIELLMEKMLTWGKPLSSGSAQADWSAHTLPTALPSGAETDQPAPRSGLQSLWRGVRRFLGVKPRELPPAPIWPLQEFEPPATYSIPVTTSRSEEPHSFHPAATQTADPFPTPSLSKAASSVPGGVSSTPEPPALPVTLLPALRDHPQPTPPDHSPGLPPISPAPVLNAYLLGSFHVTLCDIPIEAWPSGRSRAVFAYLLYHAPHPVSRDVLIETFWPDIRFDSARNSLNVAIYTLRQALKSVCEIPIILLHDASYQIHPDLQVWVDVQAFEQHAQDAARLASSGSPEAAACDDKLAVSLYQGDLLADTPYEEWTTLPRERLRVLYLETLDHLSRIFFNQGAYDACIGLCQRILTHDACREDAHSRLMRCYARQGQVHLALRQYQICVDALRTELDVNPSSATVQLYRQIKQQETV